MNNGAGIPMSTQSLSLGLLPLRPPDPAANPPPPPPPPAIGRVRLTEITPYDGAPCGAYASAVEALSASLMHHNAAVIEVGADDAVVLRCALESTRMFFRARAQCADAGGGWGKPAGKGAYTYRAGRALEDEDLSPPCMSDAFRCLGKAARAALCAIARHLRLRSDVFNHLLDDIPLPANEVSSSVLVSTYSHASLPNIKGSWGVGKSSNPEVEKGLLTLITSDNPGIQVCDPNGRWYLADGCLGPGDLLLLTGRALSHATAGLRPAASYRTAADYSSGIFTGGRASLTFRQMPQANAVLDCSLIATAGHIIPQSYQPISVSQFMDNLSAEEDIICSLPDKIYGAPNNPIMEPSLRSILSDPLSGTFLEDAVVVSCGHSFGGKMLKKVLELARCTICNTEIDRGSLYPNLALRGAATAVKNADDRRLFHNATLRKRRKDNNGETSTDGDSPRQLKGVQYPFAVNEQVLIKGNRRTPDKFVGRQAVITSQCLNGWYLLKILDSGESVRLQYRSLRKLPSPQGGDRTRSQALVQSSS
ncbi:uncharacterized protein M6B38_122485 [Iris pallida]|uniref:PUB 62/63 C-terminal domain-containing protein n=1 Tax=Iris pallida TaxID=29817 RepID=A0AAX6H2P4_IRIPA|nr:uncharacterized protein M6B38_122485 [Iris pallida]